jgi:hypothetical protein
MMLELKMGQIYNFSFKVNELNENIKLFIKKGM